VTDLDRFDAGQLRRMAGLARSQSAVHYRVAEDIIASMAALGPDQTDEFELRKLDHRAAVAAGHEQFELSRRLEREIADRSARHA
jgi:hypothetical protein